MSKNLTKVMLGIIIVPVLVFLGYWGYLAYLAPKPPPPPPANSNAEFDGRPLIISAEGKVAPHHYAHLSFNIPGLVEMVMVKEGDEIQEGQVIAFLKGREEREAAVSAAELEVLAAEQALDELNINAPIVTAQAQQDLAHALDALHDAENRWEANQEGQRGSEETIEATESNLALAEAAVQRAQREYNRVSDRPDDDPVKNLAASALAAATNTRNRLLGQLYWYQGTPSEIDQAILDADVAMAEAQVADAERRWEAVKDGPDPDDVTLAEARLESAQSQLEAARASLDDLELRAPISGTIVTLNLKEGEFISPGIPVVLLADFTRWQVQTTDLTENDLAFVSPGMEVSITLNAFPDQAFRGVVREIALLGEERRGSVTYTISIDFDPGASPVQWEMTAFVDITLP